MIETELVAEPAAPHPAAPSGWRQWHLVAVVTIMSILSQSHRSGLDLMVNPIKADLQISDVQMSLLISFALVPVLCLVIIPAGYLADMFSRRMILGLAGIFWSSMVMLCGFAGSYWELFIGRAGVGVEGVQPPVSFALLRDGVHPRNRSRAFAIYLSGLALGSGVSSLVGGELYGLASGGAFAGVPVLTALKPWQIAIAVPGIVGVILSLLVFTVREPARMTQPGQVGSATFSELGRHLRQNWRVYLPIFGSVVTVSLGRAGFDAWLPATIGRTWGLSPAVIGRTMGLLTIVLFPIATYTLGYVMDHFVKRGARNSPFWVALVGCVLNIGPVLFVLQAPSVPTMWVGCAFTLIFTTFGVQIACGTMLSNVTPSRLMGKVSALYNLSINLIGSWGPTIVAVIAQYLFEGPLAIGRAVMVSYLTFMVVTLALLYFGTREITRWYFLNDRAGAASHTG